MATPEPYVDSFVMPVAKAQIEDYKQFAEKMAAIAKKHGAIAYVNCLADDVKPGKETSFPQAVKLRSDEIVVSSWAVYPSRAERDRANQAILADEASKFCADFEALGLAPWSTAGAHKSVGAGPCRP
jgi:uncharacterized protein YbaA (DUF1428 family)